MSTQENWAVSQLIKAEQEASQIIKEAEEQRSKILNMARESAQQDIDKFKLDQESKYQQTIAQLYDTSNDFDAKKEEQKNKAEIDEITKQFQQNQKKVVDMLINQILDVQVEISDTVKQEIIQLEGQKKKK